MILQTVDMIYSVINCLPLDIKFYKIQLGVLE